MKYADVVEVKCLDVECPHWGWIKIPFRGLVLYWWEDCRDRGIEITFKCPACGEEHEITVN